jgi:hypothetical protein
VNLRREDLRRLRGPIVLAIGAVVFGLVCLFLADSYRDSARKTQAGTRASRVVAQERVLRVSEEEREIRENLIDYERMREQGMMGDLNRLDWIEAISRIKNNRKLFEIKYNIEAQRQLEYAGVVPASGAEFVVSRMRLDMLLLHENDLLDFLSDLQAARRAYVSVRQCNVTRLDRGAASGGTGVQPRLRADCQVDLVSVRAMRPA